MFEFFFRFFKPRLAQHFDPGHTEFLDKKQGEIFPDDNPKIKTRFVNKLIKVYRKTVRNVSSSCRSKCRAVRTGISLKGCLDTSIVSAAGTDRL